MKTYVPPIAEVKRKWFLIDVEGKTLGRVATVAADLLRGKGKPDFIHHLDMGDGVIIINAEKVHLSGAKRDQKMYHTHSGYAGGIKSVPAHKKLDEKPEAVLQHAIAGMIPKNKLKKDVLKRLRIFAGAEHPLSAQKPETVTV